MKNQFDAVLTGSDSLINGKVDYTNFTGFTDVYEFNSFDDTLHLVIGKDNDGEWVRIKGTEPYLSSWVGELAEQVAANK